MIVRKTAALFAETNDAGQSFPQVNYGSVAANQWTVISIPMSQLNPNNQTINRVDIQDISGSAKTFYVDDIKFTGAAQASSSLADAKEVAGKVVPRIFAMAQNYPNPFNPSTTIEFTLADDGHALVKIYNILGQEIAALFDETAQAGKIYRLKFDGSALPSGFYVARLETVPSNGQAGKQQLLRKMLLAK